MPAIESTANDLETAISAGLAQLRLLRAEVRIEVLDEGSKGVLGFGQRQARVRLTPMSELDVPAAPPPADAPPPPAPAPVEPPPPADADVDDEFDTSLSEGEIELAREFTQGVLDRLGLETTVDVEVFDPVGEETHPSIRVNISGDDANVLLNHQHEALNALQTVVQSMWSHQTKHGARLSLDANGYKANREVRIRQMAERMAERVIESGKPITLEPMLPAERRLVHVALRDNPHVFTESVGEGGNRRVQIKPKK